MAEIRWTKESEKWLKDIFDYIAIDNPKIAFRVVESLYLRVQILKRWPQVGYRYDKFHEHNIRILLHGHYRIPYLIHSNGDIDILGIFHGALDMDRYLFN